MTLRSRVLPTLCGALLLIGACGGDQDRSTSESGAPTPAAGKAGDGDVAFRVGDAGPVEALGGAATGAGGGVVAQVAPSSDRELIYRADLAVRVKDPVAAAEEAGDAARESGGLVFSQRTSDDSPSELVLRVPPDRLDELLDDLAGLGDEESRSVEAEDVTERVVDLDARIATARASVERLRGLIAESKTVPEVVAVETELTKRETELETLTGQQRQLEDQVSMATVRLRLQQRSSAAPSDDIPSFLDGLRTGGAALVNALLVGATVLGFLLPFLAALALLAVPVVALWRRRRARGTALTTES